jgi:hypothetical protein
MKQFKYDDIDGLQSLVSSEFGAWSNEVEVTQEMVNQFATLTGDDYWLHTDPERCKNRKPVRHHHRARLPHAGSAAQNANAAQLGSNRLQPHDELRLQQTALHRRGAGWQQNSHPFARSLGRKNTERPNLRDHGKPHSCGRPRAPCGDLRIDVHVHVTTCVCSGLSALIHFSFLLHWPLPH